ncbi:MAG: thermonuclease family protein [Actinomycetota bacterium]
MRGATIVLSCAVALVASLAPSSSAVPASARRAHVTHVTDGDTAYLRPLRYGDTAQSWPGRSARFIGVDTPETYGDDECFGPQASAFTERKLEGRRVKVTYGEDPQDPYGRALIYVWRKGRLFNATLVRRGFATVLIIPPNDRYENKLRRLQAAARAAGRGLWSACR